MNHFPSRGNLRAQFGQSKHLPKHLDFVRPWLYFPIDNLTSATITLSYLGAGTHSGTIALSHTPVPVHSPGHNPKSSLQIVASRNGVALPATRGRVGMPTPLQLLSMLLWRNTCECN